MHSKSARHIKPVRLSARNCGVDEQASREIGGCYVREKLIQIGGFPVRGSLVFDVADELTPLTVPPGKIRAEINGAGPIESE